MTQISRFWEGSTIGDATEAPYDAGTEFSKVLMSIAGAAAVATNLSGVFRNELNQLAVSGVATPVTIDTGRSMVWGAWYENDAAATVAIPTPAAATRIDRIVARKDWAAQTVRITRIAGVEGGGAPALVQIAGTTWDEPLAQVSINVGGVITVTDERQFIGGTAALPTSWTTGALIYGVSASALGSLTIGANRSVLTSNGTLPSWSTTPTVEGLVANSSGIQVTAGNVGVGIAPAATTGLRINGAILSGATSQYGNRVDPTFSSAATVAGYGDYIQVVTAAAVFTLTDAYGSYIATPSKGAGSAITNAYGLYVEAQTAGGTLNYAIYTNAGLVRFGGATTVASGGLTVTAGGATITAGNLGIGIAAQAIAGLYVSTTATTGVSQYGIVSDSVTASDATTASVAGYFKIRTAAAAYTTVTATGVLVDTFTKGAGSAITTARGVYVAAQTAGGTNNYGVYIEAPSGGATTNIGLYNAGTSQLNGTVGIGLAPQAARALIVYSNAGLTGATQEGISVITVFSSAASTAYGVNSQISTAAAAFTLGTGRAFYASAPTVGAGSAITTLSGFYVANQGAANITNAYGIYIEAQSGAATTNIGLYNAGTTMLAAALTVSAGGATITAGNLGIGTAQVAQYGAIIGGTLTGATVQHIVRAIATFDSNATASAISVYSGATIANSIFTASSVYGFYADNPTKGASATITSLYGAYIAAQTRGGTNNYGVYIEAPSGGSGVNYALYTPGVIALNNASGSLAGGVADTVLLGAYDLSAGNATLSLSTETAVTAAAAGASDAYLNVRINGTTYKLLLHT